MERKIVLCVILLILLVGCGKTKITESYYEEQLLQHEGLGVKECSDRRMEFVAVSMVGFNEWEVVCFTKSPLRHYRFGVSKK